MEGWGASVFLGRQLKGSLVRSPSDLLKVSLGPCSMCFALWRYGVRGLFLRQHSSFFP